MSEDADRTQPTDDSGGERELGEWVRRAKAGDDGAWEQLWKTHKALIASWVQGMGGPLGMTRDDLVQEAMQALLLQLREFTFQGRAGWLGWMRLVVQHRLTDLQRQRKAEKRAGEPEPGLDNDVRARRLDGREGTTPSAAAIRKQQEDSCLNQRVGEYKLTPRVCKALERLDTQKRTLLVEVRIKGRPIREVMPEVGISVYPTATSTLARAVREFSNALQQE